MSDQIKDFVGGRPNLQKLAKQGRIKLKPNGDIESVPLNNIVQKNVRPIMYQGVKVGEKVIEVNAGHARAEGSVWRIALRGPKKYHEKVLADNIRKEGLQGGKFTPSAPDLTPEESAEYKQYVDFLAEKGVDIAEDAEFYASLTEKKPGRPKKVVEPSDNA